jgi:hypothetical protein
MSLLPRRVYQIARRNKASLLCAARTCTLCSVCRGKKIEDQEREVRMFRTMDSSRVCTGVVRLSASVLSHPCICKPYGTAQTEIQARHQVLQMTSGKATLITLSGQSHVHDRFKSKAAKGMWIEARSIHPISPMGLSISQHGCCADDWAGDPDIHPFKFYIWALQHSPVWKECAQSRKRPKKLSAGERHVNVAAQFPGRQVKGWTSEPNPADRYSIFMQN